MESAGSGAVTTAEAGITHTGKFEDTGVHSTGAGGRRTSSCEEGQQNKARTCTICQKILSRPSHLYRHLRSVHGAEKNYQCPVCGMRFVNGSNARRHAAHFHGDAATIVLPGCDNVNITDEPRSERCVFQSSVALRDAYNTKRSEERMNHEHATKASTVNENFNHNRLTSTDDPHQHQTTDKSCAVDDAFAPDSRPDPPIDAAAPGEVVENNPHQGQRREPFISSKRRRSTERAASCHKRPKTSPRHGFVIRPEVRSPASFNERRRKGGDRFPTSRHSPRTHDERSRHIRKSGGERRYMERAQEPHTATLEQRTAKSTRCSADKDNGEMARFDRVVMGCERKCRRHKHCSRTSWRRELMAMESDSGSEGSFNYTDGAHKRHCRYCNHERRNSHERHRRHYTDLKYVSCCTYGYNKRKIFKKCAGEKLSDREVDTYGGTPVHPLRKHREPEKGVHTPGEMKRSRLPNGDYIDKESVISGQMRAVGSKRLEKESSNNMKGKGKSHSDDDRYLPDKNVSDDDEMKRQRHTSICKTRDNDSFVKKPKALPTLLQLLLQDTPTGTEIQKSPCQTHCQGKRTWSTTSVSEGKVQGLLGISRDHRNLEGQYPCILKSSLCESNEGSRINRSCHRIKVQGGQTVNGDLSACVENIQDTECLTSSGKHNRASCHHNTLVPTGLGVGPCQCNMSSANRIASEFEDNGLFPNETHPQLSCRLRLAKRSRHHKTDAASHQSEAQLKPPCNNVHRVCNETALYKASETCSPRWSSHSSTDGSASSYDRNFYNLSSLVDLDAATHSQVNDSSCERGRVSETTRRRTCTTRNLSDALLLSPRNSRATRIGLGDSETPSSSSSISLLNLSQGKVPQWEAEPGSKEISCKQGSKCSATHACDTCPSEPDVDFSKTRLSDEETVLPTGKTGGHGGCGKDLERPPTPEFRLKKDMPEWIALYQAAAYCDEILAEWAQLGSRHSGTGPS